MQQSARIAPLLSDGQVIGTITVIEDVTERVAYEEELRGARDEAEASTRAKDQFIAILSHDLRTPLTGMIGWAQVLRKSNLDPARTHRAIDAILNNASFQLQMIDDLLDVSRITAGKLRPEFESADLLELVQAAIESLRPVIEAKGVRFVQILPTIPRMASVDPKRIKQVVWNLLSNALKFTPPGGTIELELEFRDDCAELRVKDTGAGISKEALPRIFEAMWQAHASGEVPGLGLGLSIVHYVVSSHGGSVRAESPGVGQGAQFIVQLPWNRPEVAARPARRFPRGAPESV